MIRLSETTIYGMERRGEFPRRFHLTPRSVVWDLSRATESVYITPLSVRTAAPRV
ncbi:AlpA family phage regulatory protein [Stutzerimonas xanthomarina]|uniref:AlpA family phage regulatory protein n=1 Tax=Stutzerimonas xanthomarina TaxID=271420 RepID=A0A3R8VBG5_9GAMM|nr:AlpA family phage regulatory protein [Stutzerimonas stutzeri]RRV13407.1 AlpA family phage regulatory protein [Stutzerimonas xanthomarina]